MFDLKNLVIASGNKGKLREIGTLLAPLKIAVVPQSDFNITEIDEPHPTFIENALIKARHASRQTGLPALADDSGICVNALKGAPGVFSARYAGEPKSDQRNNMKLVEALKTSTDRSAYYYCVAVLLRHAEIRNPLSRRVCGMASLFSSHAVMGDSVTIPTFCCLNSAERLRSLIWTQKIRSVTAARRWQN